MAGAVCSMAGGDQPPNRTDGFVRTHFVAVCRGPYSKDLVKAWKQ